MKYSIGIILIAIVVVVCLPYYYKWHSKQSNINLINTLLYSNNVQDRINALNDIASNINSLNIDLDKEFANYLKHEQVFVKGGKLDSGSNVCEYSNEIINLFYQYDITASINPSNAPKDIIANIIKFGNQHKDDNGATPFALEGPIRNICVADFYMDKYEVTIDKYYLYYFIRYYTFGNDAILNQTIRHLGDYHPITNRIISYQDAMRYAEYNQFSLPKESEWEYACKFDANCWDNTNEFSKISKYAWIRKYPISDSGILVDQVNEVGMLLPNNYGLYDILGNVAEWCEKDTTKVYPNISKCFYIAKGGSCSGHYYYLRPTARYLTFDNEVGDNEVGFRCVRYIK